MKRFENKVLYIESEKMLEEMKRVLNDKNLPFDKLATKITSNKMNYLKLYSFDGQFSLGAKLSYHTELTKEEFINLLNE